jgi:hypothetical protein
VATQSNPFKTEQKRDTQKGEREREREREQETRNRKNVVVRTSFRLLPLLLPLDVMVAVVCGTIRLVAELIPSLDAMVTVVADDETNRADFWYEEAARNGV